MFQLAAAHRGLGFRAVEEQSQQTRAIFVPLQLLRSRVWRQRRLQFRCERYETNIDGPGAQQSAGAFAAGVAGC